MGISKAKGMALANRLKGSPRRIFVLTGDGELQEGSNWEAIMAAGHFKLDNLTAIVDRNRLQQGDATERTIALEPLADRWHAFGWSVVDVDGHDIGELVRVFDRLPLERGRPTCVIARTFKGRGISFIEDRVDWHHRVPTDAEMAAALLELEDDGGAE
jgi:transketolase